jgi:hypothetical protein
MLSVLDGHRLDLTQAFDAQPHSLIIQLHQVTVYGYQHNDDAKSNWHSYPLEERIDAIETNGAIKENDSAHPCHIDHSLWREQRATVGGTNSTPACTLWHCHSWWCWHYQPKFDDEISAARL